MDARPGSLLFLCPNLPLLLWDTGEEPVSASCHTPKNHRREGKSQFLVSLTRSLQHLKKRNFWKPVFRWTHFFPIWPSIYAGKQENKFLQYQLPLTIPSCEVAGSSALPHQWSFIPNGVNNNGENRNPGALIWSICLLKSELLPIFLLYDTPNTSIMPLTPILCHYRNPSLSRSLSVTLYHIHSEFPFNFTQQHSEN